MNESNKNGALGWAALISEMDIAVHQTTKKYFDSLRVKESAENCRVETGVGGGAGTAVRLLQRK